VRFTHWSTGGAALPLVAGLGACTAEDTPTGAAAPGDIAAFCAATLDLEASFSVGLLAADGIQDLEERAAALEEWNATTRQQVDGRRGHRPRGGLR
jgi:hypothetical protein